MLDLLDELGIADDTFVMYSTDNGPHRTPDQLHPAAGPGGTGAVRGGTCRAAREPGFTALRRAGREANNRAWPARWSVWRVHLLGQPPMRGVGAAPRRVPARRR